MDKNQRELNKSKHASTSINNWLKYILHKYIVQLSEQVYANEITSNMQMWDWVHHLQRKSGQQPAKIASHCYSARLSPLRSVRGRCHIPADRQTDGGNSLIILHHNYPACNWVRPEIHEIKNNNDCYEYQAAPRPLSTDSTI